MRNDLIKGYLGTYYSQESAGIYAFSFNRNTGSVSEPALWYGAPNSKYLSLRGGLLATPLTYGDRAGLRLLDTSDGAPMGSAFVEKQAACFVVQDEDRIYTANYHEGSVIIYNRRTFRIEKRIETGEGSGCHQILLHGRYVIAICLLRDEALIFDRAAGYEEAGRIGFEKGTGPRHGVFDREHKRLFIVSELSNKLFVFKTVGDKGFEKAFESDILKKGAIYETAPTSAAIRLAPDERYLYISTRGADVITAFRIKGNGAEMIQQVKSGGKHPRDIALSGDGRFILAVNRDEGGMVVFKRDGKSGLIGEKTAQADVAQAVSIVLDED